MTTTTLPPTPAPARDGAHDFDFLHGSWRVRNRRLRRALAGGTEWYEFDGRTVERPLWDGRANVEEYDATLPDGTRLRGLALRLYDPRARRWTIHWANAAAGTLDAPMTGAFHDGVGEFLGRDAHDGRPVLVRFRWTHDGPDAARWEQAFSADDGATWETNWVMDFARERPTIAVHRAGPGDVDAAAPLFDAYRRFYGMPSDVAAARAFLAERLARDESVVLLARADGEPAGLAQLYRTFSSVSLGRVVVLNDLYVAPAFRRGGAGRALVEAAVAEARRQGAIRLELATQHANLGAQALYRSLGFVRDDEFAHLGLALG